MTKISTAFEAYIIVIVLRRYFYGIGRAVVHLVCSMKRDTNEHVTGEIQSCEGVCIASVGVSRVFFWDWCA